MASGRITTKEAIKHYEVQAKKLRVLAMARNNPVISDVYQKRAMMLEQRANVMKALWGKALNTAALKHEKCSEMSAISIR